MAEPQAPAKPAEPAQEPIELVTSDDGDAEVAPSFTVTVSLPNGEKIDLPLTANDTVMEVRQFLSDATASCYMTSYMLHWNGQPLSETAELETLGEQLALKPTLVMKDTPYNEHSARMHVRRLREVLAFLNAPERSPSVFTQLDNTEENVSEEEKAAIVAEFDKPVSISLAKYYPTAKQERPSSTVCIKSMAFSGWNPPPGNRRLQGDLFYIEITTPDSKQLFITASVSGFFVNQSTRTVFNPAAEKNAKKCHHLVDLLRSASPAFAKGFAEVLDHEFGFAHPFELLPVPAPVIPWTLRQRKHSYEQNRLDDACLSIDPPGLTRDWNEEFQTCYEQPKTDIREGIMRDRALIKVVSEFLEAATKGAIAIVHKTVLPLNPQETERTHMWMYSNIFFSSAADVREQYAQWGGDATSYKGVKIDLNGANRLFQLHYPDVRPVLTAVIDYRGHRLTAQAILPGIMQNSSTERVVYGSPDPGKQINVDGAFKEALIPLAKLLHLAERTVKDPVGGASVTLHTSIDSKGVYGADGRRYFMDLSRVMPRDANFKDEPHRLLAVHRFEFVAQLENYYSRLICVSEEELQKRNLTDVERRVVVSLRAANQKYLEWDQGKREAIARIGALREEVSKQEKPTPEQAKEFEAQRQKLQTMQRIDYAFNSDLWGPAELIITSEERAKQEDLLVAAAHFLKHRLIPEQVKEWVEGAVHVPIDGQSLTHSLHRLGVNMRYLGCIAQQAKKDLPFLTTICVLEMVARAAKHIFNAILKSVTDDSQLALTISHFLNALLGKRETEDKKKKTEGKPAAATESAESAESAQPARIAVPSLTTTALWELIAKVLKEEYNYAFTKEERNTVARLALLRAVCLKVGLQIAARDYDWAVEQPFSPTDVLDLYPVVRTLLPRSQEGTYLLEEGRANLSMGHLDVAFQHLTEALAIFHQVYGPMHPETAACYANLGTMLYSAGDTAQAAVHQRKAVIVYERVCGLDHHDTITAYHQLSNFVNVSSQLVLGLRFLYRAMMLTSLVSGGVHPNHAQDLSNAAVMLQECGSITLALRYLSDALRVTEAEKPNGPMSEQTAAVCHMMAFVHGNNGDFKDALNFEKRTYYIYRQLYGENHQRTSDANTWLKQFTAQAVQTRRETNKQYEELVAAAWKDPKLRRMVQSQLGSSGRPSPAEVSQLINKLRSPETLQRFVRNVSGLPSADGAAPKGAPSGNGPRMGGRKSRK